MNDIIFSQIPIDELVLKIKEAILQEFQPSVENSSKKIEKPVTTKQLCSFLGVTEPTVLRWRQKGRIPFFMIGSAVRFNLSEVIEALKKQKYPKREN